MAVTKCNMKFTSIDATIRALLYQSTEKHFTCRSVGLQLALEPVVTTAAVGKSRNLLGELVGN